MKRELTKTSRLLLWICAGLETIDGMIITPYELGKRVARGNLFKSSRNFDSFLYYLVRQGYIKLVDKNNECFIKITKKGELHALLAKSKLQKVPVWDGKWRVIVFDIPEESRIARDKFRKLLKIYGYRQLQASVFISPYPLNREAIKYLKESELISYIRIMKVEEMDDDADLRRIFNLKR